jgi:hypothetical protein
MRQVAFGGHLNGKPTTRPNGLAQIRFMKGLVTGSIDRRAARSDEEDADPQPRPVDERLPEEMKTRKWNQALLIEAGQRRAAGIYSVTGDPDTWHAVA